MKSGLRSAIALCLAAMASSCSYAKREQCEEWRPPPVHPKFAAIGPEQCSGSVLNAHGFGGILDRFASMEYLGKIQAGAIVYSIFYYDRNENHGNHAVVILEDGCKYFGSYGVDDRPIGIRGQDIVFKKTENYGNVIRFTGISPPARVIIDGADVRFVL